MNTRKSRADLDAILGKPGYSLVAAGRPVPPQCVGREIPPPPANKPRLRQDRKGPNKTEAAFTAWLRAHGLVVHPQGVTLLLANGLRYTPDDFAPASAVTEYATADHRPTFYEVKGFARDDAVAKLKMAARVHDWARFVLATKRPKRDGGGWALETVLP